MRSKLLRCAKQFIDVALAVADMDAPPRMIEEFGGLLQVLQPSDALFLLDGNPRRIDLSFKRRSSFELVGVQNFTTLNPSGSPAVVIARLECIKMPQPCTFSDCRPNLVCCF
jgi:hypothetical protein